MALSVLHNFNAHLCQANGGTSLHAPVYNLLSADLRLPPSETLATLLTSSSINPSNPSSLRPDPLLSPSLPTLLLFECVLVYMPPEASSSLIQWFVDYFATNNQKGWVLGCIVYEMFGLGDPFGRVMLNNLKVMTISRVNIVMFRVDHLFPTSMCCSSRGTYYYRGRNLTRMNPLCQIGSSTIILPPPVL